jgi:two-component system, OmpR family, response regulator
LVEDHADSRELLEAILRARGAEVVAVGNSALALEGFCTRAPDVVISDIEMPDEDGFTMMRKMRDIEREQQRRPIPAIAVSAHSPGEVRLHALRAGYQSFLAKPIRVSELEATVLSLRHSPAPQPPDSA